MDFSIQLIKEKKNLLSNKSINSYSPAHQKISMGILITETLLKVTKISPCELAGLQTSQDAHFYAMSSRFADFSNKDQPLVIQFTVKHEQSIDCGGGYIKLFPSDLKQEDIHGDSTYNIMFGEYLNSHFID